MTNSTTQQSWGSPPPCPDHEPFLITYSRPWWTGFKKVFWARCTTCDSPDGPYDTKADAQAVIDSAREARFEWIEAKVRVYEHAVDRLKQRAERHSHQPTGTGWPA